MALLVYLDNFEDLKFYVYMYTLYLTNEGLTQCKSILLKKWMIQDILTVNISIKNYKKKLLCFLLKNTLL